MFITSFCVVVLAILTGSAHASFLNRFKSPLQGRSQAAWSIRKFSSLVAFGDSYTDEDRLNYFLEHNFNPPPVGWREPPVRIILAHSLLLHFRNFNKHAVYLLI